ncbi:MAG: hypothetical protein JWN43_1599 [Gammaproteobacteria bacterium]|nr:hypothetical protein [Gammaproteobacteria bacterium]
MSAADIDQALKCKARMVLADERAIDVLPPGERVIVALILDRADLLPSDYTMLDAFDRLGPELAEAAVCVQRAGLECEEVAHG